MWDRGQWVRWGMEGLRKVGGWGGAGGGVMHRGGVHAVFLVLQ